MEMASIFVNFPLIDSTLSEAGILFYLMSCDVLTIKSVSQAYSIIHPFLFLSLFLSLLIHETMFVCIFDNKSALHAFIIPPQTKPIANAPYICIIASGYKL